IQEARVHEARVHESKSGTYRGDARLRAVQACLRFLLTLHPADSTNLCWRSQWPTDGTLLCASMTSRNDPANKRRQVMVIHSKFSLLAGALAMLFAAALAQPAA